MKKMEHFLCEQIKEIENARELLMSSAKVKWEVKGAPIALKNAWNLPLWNRLVNPVHKTWAEMVNKDGEIGSPSRWARDKLNTPREWIHEYLSTWFFIESLINLLSTLSILFVTLQKIDVVRSSYSLVSAPFYLHRGCWWLICVRTTCLVQGLRSRRSGFCEVVAL